MATTIVDRSSVGIGGDCRAVLQAAANANPNNTLRLTNSVENIWNISGYSQTDGTGNGLTDQNTNLGAIEFNNNILQLDPGVIVQEMFSTPLVGIYQPLLRWKGRTNVGIIFGSGSKLLGQRSLHPSNPAIPATYSEWRAGAKFIGCNGVTITGVSGEEHSNNFGGDGIWFASGAYPALGITPINTGGWTNLYASQNVNVTDVRCSGNLRGGIVAEDCVGSAYGVPAMFRNCGGVDNIGRSPQAFMIIEPDTSGDSIQLTVDGGDCEGCSHGIAIQIGDALTNPILINLLNHDSLQGSNPNDLPWGFTFQVNGVTTPAGSRIFAENLTCYNIKYAGMRFSWPLDNTNPCVLYLRHCALVLCSTLGLDTPLDFGLSGANSNGGGIYFDDCYVFESSDRAIATVAGGTFTNVRGTIWRDFKGPYPGVSQYLSTLPNLKIRNLKRRKTVSKRKRRANIL